MHEYLQSIEYMGEYITASHYVRHSLSNKLIRDTCLMPEVQNCTNLDCALLEWAEPCSAHN